MQSKISVGKSMIAQGDCIEIMQGIDAEPDPQLSIFEDLNAISR